VIGPVAAAPEIPHPQLLGRIAAFAAIYVLWGGTFLALRYAVAEVPPMLTIAIRCAGGAILLGSWCLIRGTLVQPTAAEWRVAAVAGTLLFLGCHTLLAGAERRVSSGQAALLLTSIPLWLVVLDAARARRRPSARVFAGLIWPEVPGAGRAVASITRQFCWLDCSGRQDRSWLGMECDRPRPCSPRQCSSLSVPSSSV